MVNPHPFIQEIKDWLEEPPRRKAVDWVSLRPLTMMKNLRLLLARLPWIGKYLHPYVGQYMWINKELAIIKTFDGTTATIKYGGEPIDSTTTITF